jgi:hypothetical protein
LYLAASIEAVLFDGVAFRIVLRSGAARRSTPL